MSVSFKLPAGELKWWIVFWLVLNTAALIYAFVSHDYRMAGSAFVTLMLAIGVCFQVRLCAWILVFLLSIQALSIFMRDVVAAEKWLRLAKVGLNLWLTYLLFQWLRSDEAESE